MKKFLSVFLAVVMAMSLAMFASCGESSSTASESCKHTETEVKVIREATCTVDGKETVKCKSCGKVLEEKALTKLGHLFVAGFCSRTGCGAIDPANNKFYANMLISATEQSRVTLKNNGDIVIKTDMNKPEKAEEIKITDVELLSGKSEGESESDEKRLVSAKIKVGEVDGELCVVDDGEEIKLVVKNVGEEKLYLRVDENAALEVIKSAISGLPADIPGIGGSSGGTSIDFPKILDTIKKADGTDSTVKQINTILHNLVSSVTSVSETDDGFALTLDYDKCKELNHTVATQTVKDFVDNMFGEKTFDSYFPIIITVAVQADKDLTEDEQTAKIEEVTNDCKTKNLYDVIEKYANKDSEEPLDLENKIDEAIEVLRGIEISLNTDKTGNIKSMKLAFNDWEFATGSSEGSVIQLPSVHIAGEIEIGFDDERIVGDAYAPFEETSNAHDTALAAGTYAAAPTSTDVKSVTIVTNEKGDITRIETLYVNSTYNSETGENDYEYFKVINVNPVEIIRATEEGEITYTVYNLIEYDNGTDTIVLKAADIEVYRADENGNVSGEALTEDEVKEMSGTIGHVEFTLAPQA